MRDIGERRPGAPRQEKQDSFWWFKGLFFVAAILMTLAHFGLQRSFALERAAVGERVKALGDLIQETKENDRLRELDYEQSKASELSRIEDYSEDDRTGLAAIIAGGE